LSWAYILSDENSWSEVTPEKCSACQSTEIENMDLNLNDIDLENFSIKVRKF
jgi:Ni,Fe-hydrogenase III small subunit